MSLNVNVPREDLLSGLASLQNITGKKGTIAILSNVLIQTQNDSVDITATDLEVGIRNTIPAEILSPGSITLPAKKLFEIIRESNADSIHLETQENNWVKITAQSSNYNLAGMPSDEFPSFPEYNEENLLPVSSSLLKELIDKTIISVAQEGESQFNLSGILFEKDTDDENEKYIRMVSSDGHRLSLMQKTIDSELKLEKKAIIPRKGIHEIRKFCETNEKVKLGFDEKQAVIITENSVIIIRLMNGDFPVYNNIINIVNKDKYIEIDRIQLLQSIKRMNLFTEDRHNAVKFNFKDNKLILSSENMDIGNAKEEIKINYSGDELLLGFNGRYFVDALQVMKSEKIRSYINSSESPCLIEGEDDPGFLCVIMPMKI